MVARPPVLARIRAEGQTSVQFLSNPRWPEAFGSAMQDARNQALTAVQIGLLTIYDMCKAADRGMVMGEIRVLEKHGGKSGDWVAPG